MMSNQSPQPSRPPRPNDRRGFEIAVICALTLEADAIEALFDHHWDDDGPPFDKEPGDPNAYSTGTIGRFNVVLAYMPGMGKVNAATVASNCGKSFPGIKLALVVGICGVVPFGPANDEVVLGDVIISNGVIQYDFGRQLPGHFVRKDTLLDIPGRPNLEIRGVLTKLQGLRHRRQLSAKITEYLDVLRQDQDLHADYPGSTEDRLFESSYLHTNGHMSCEQLGCNGKLVSRSRLANAEASTTPTIHVGLMASGDAVMKSGKDRDRIAAAEGVIAFEMEGAGVWDSFPCIIIKGACDYADSHKSKLWQRYAAATAAACAKAFLSFWVPLTTQGNRISNIADTSTCTSMSELEGWITDILLSSIPPESSNSCKALFHFDLSEFSAYMRDEYPSHQDIGKVLIVTGSSTNAYANSAESYVRWQWRENGMAILQWMLQLTEGSPDGTGRNITLEDEGNGSTERRIELKGEPDDISSIALQIAWILSVFRKSYKSPQDMKPILALSTAEVVYHGLHDLDVGAKQDIMEDKLYHHFQFGLRNLDAINDQTDAGCWNAIFRTFVIGSGFPIPTRSHSLRGIELPLGLMIKLSQVDYMLPFLDSFSWKGPTTAIVPRFVDGSGKERCIQWHLIQTLTQPHLSMEQVHKELGAPNTLFTDKLSELPEDGGIDKAAYEHFLKSVASDENRHFLGLYRDSEIHLGTHTSRAQDVEDSEGLNRSPVRVTWANTIATSTSFSTLGIGISLGTSWTLSLAASLEAPDNLPDNDIVYNACNRVSVMYDTSTRTAWMVPEASVIFHLVQARYHQTDMQASETNTPGDPTFPSPNDMRHENIANTCRNILAHAGRDSRANCFRVFAKRFQQLREKIILSRRGLPLRFRFHSYTSHDVLSGVPFKQMSRYDETCKIMQADISERTGGGWTDMIKEYGKENPANEILVFFGNYRDDPIRPSVGLTPRPCSSWNVVPRNRDYLVAMVSSIRMLANNTNPPMTSRRYYWNSCLHNPFDCRARDCNRLQTLLTSRPQLIRYLPPETSDDGTIVFGANFDPEHIPCQQL
ncbi:hypothetical protein F53441_10030 [Fusarium austroafricanum]|uniref:Nucleoside phosphorylase domain-containing protein n=1 Tax=Fusarium austroafricanum TaxID=2364996 RepID=A0A8H4NPM8_9HYPO|nr:hypothetical protein F53441_10030 [Fusarium austroafricanum]